MSGDSIEVEDFQWLQAWLRERSGILLEDGNVHQVQTRLTPLLWRHQLPTLKALLESLRGDPPTALATEALEALAKGDTWFFRDMQPFEALRKEIIPGLLQSRSRERSLTVWAAGCGTGQEAYSLALLLRHHFPATREWKIRLVGTDAFEEAVERAREGLYTLEEVNRGLPVVFLMKYFEQEGSRWRLVEDVRRMVEFSVGRTDQAQDDEFPCDLILMRNLISRFEPGARRATLERTRARLVPGGIFFLGRSERSEILEGWEEVPTSWGYYYRKEAGGAK